MVESYWHGKSEVLGEKYFRVWVECNGRIRSNWGMLQTGEIWSTGRKLYSLVGKWLNKCGAIVECYWEVKIEVLREKIYSMNIWCLNECRGMVERYWLGKFEVLREYILECVLQVDWCVWSNGGMLLTGEYWSTGRKKVYSMCDRWLKEFGEIVEWYWQGKRCTGRKILNRMFGRFLK